jgi:hypothetical protein
MKLGCFVRASQMLTFFALLDHYNNPRNGMCPSSYAAFFSSFPLERRWETDESSAVVFSFQEDCCQDREANSNQMKSDPTTGRFYKRCSTPGSPFYTWEGSLIGFGHRPFQRINHYTTLLREDCYGQSTSICLLCA